MKIERWGENIDWIPGVGPADFRSALLCLPDERDSLVCLSRRNIMWETLQLQREAVPADVGTIDRELIGLAFFRKFLEGIHISLLQNGQTNTSLENRMYPLTPDEIRVMETASFRGERTTIFESDWSPVAADSAWAEVFSPGDDNYAFWRVREMRPRVDLRDGFSFVAIERIHDPSLAFNRTREPFWPAGDHINVGLVKKSELDQLVNMLKVN